MPPADASWFEAPLAGVGHEQFLLDLRAPAPPPVRGWLEEPLVTRGLDADAGSSMDGGTLEQWFDVLVHRQVVTPAAGDRVFETYWTTGRGVEVVDYSYALMDLTVWGRQEPGEDSPAGWPQHGHAFRTDGGPPAWPRVSAWPGGRPTAQWSRMEAGRSDDLVGS